MDEAGVRAGEVRTMLTTNLNSTERFYLKVGGLLYRKGAKVRLKPDGLVVKSGAEKIEAERILSENIPAEHSHKRKVINPSLGELVAAMGQIDEFRNVRAQFMTQRLEEGATMKQAEEESREITEENIQKAKELRAERAKRKAKILENIESKLPKSDDPEVRARLIQAYLNEHGSEIIAESEQYTLGELKAEVEFSSSVKNEKAKSFLANYAEAEMVSEEFERNAEEGIRQVYSGLAEGFNRMMIPGYSAWASGGNAVEVISSAGSDIALTLVGGKLIKVAWTGTKALYNGAKALGKILIPGETQTIRCTPRQSELYIGKMLGTKAKPQVSYLDGKEVPYGTKGSVRPDFVMGNKAAFEVKNYDIAKNSDGLIRTVVRQVKERAIHLPKGMQQRVMIDVRGQSVSDATMDNIKQKIFDKCNGIVTRNDIKFFGE